MPIPAYNEFLTPRRRHNSTYAHPRQAPTYHYIAYLPAGNWDYKTVNGIAFVKKLTTITARYCRPECPTLRSKRASQISSRVRWLRGTPRYVLGVNCFGESRAGEVSSTLAGREPRCAASTDRGCGTPALPIGWLERWPQQPVSARSCYSCRILCNMMYITGWMMHYHRQPTVGGEGNGRETGMLRVILPAVAGRMRAAIMTNCLLTRCLRGHWNVMQ